MGTHLLIDGVISEGADTLTLIGETLTALFANMEAAKCQLFCSRGRKSGGPFRKTLNKIASGKLLFNMLTCGWAGACGDSLCKVSFSLICGHATPSWDPLPSVASELPKPLQLEGHSGISGRQQSKLFAELGAFFALSEYDQCFPSAFSLHVEYEQSSESVLAKMASALASANRTGAIKHCSINRQDLSGPMPLGHILFRLKWAGFNLSPAHGRWFRPGHILIADTNFSAPLQKHLGADNIQQTETNIFYLLGINWNTWKHAPEPWMCNVFVSTDINT